MENLVIDSEILQKSEMELITGGIIGEDLDAF